MATSSTDLLGISCPVTIYRTDIINGNIVVVYSNGDEQILGNALSSIDGDIYFDVDGNIEFTSNSGNISLGTPCGNVSIPSCDAGGGVIVNPGDGNIRLGDPENPSIIVPGDPDEDIVIAPPGAGNIRIGDPAGPGITVPSPDNTEDDIVIDPPEDGNIRIGDPGGPVITVPGPGNSDENIRIGDPENPLITVPGNPEDDLVIAPPSAGNIRIGDPAGPGITVPSPENTEDDIVIDPGEGNVRIKLGEDPWQIVYVGLDGNLTSNAYVTVSSDDDDSEGRSIYLHASEYDTGSGNKNQSVLYFVNANVRSSSVRYVDQEFGEGVIVSPYYNYNDSAFHNKNGIATWRAPIDSVDNTKVTINDDGVGPSTHGLYLGRGAIDFFQDLEGGETPDLNGLSYIIIPAIALGANTKYIGQISANPYEYQETVGNSNISIPYFGLGSKLTYAVPEDYSGDLEEYERIPGNVCISWSVNCQVKLGGNVGEGGPGIVIPSPEEPSDDLVITPPEDGNIRIGDPAGPGITVPGSGNPDGNIRIGDPNNPGITVPPSGNPIIGDPENPLIEVDPNGNPQFGITVYDEGTVLSNTVSSFNFVGNAVTATANNGNITVAVNGLTVQEEGTNISTTVTTLNFVGTGVTANTTGSTVTVTARDTVINLGGVSGSFTPNAAAGSVQKATLSGSITLQPAANMNAGQSLTLILTQGGSGSYTLTADSLYKFAANYRTLSTSVGSIDMLNMFYDGSVYYVTLTAGYV